MKTGVFLMISYRVLCKKNDKNIFLLRYSIFFIFKTIFLCTNIVYKHKSRCLRPFSSLKLTILLIFLKILFVEGLRAKFTKTGPNFRNFSKIAPETFKNRQNLNKFIKIRIWEFQSTLIFWKFVDFCRFGGLKFWTTLIMVFSCIFYKINLRQKPM